MEIIIILEDSNKSFVINVPKIPFKGDTIHNGEDIYIVTSKIYSLIYEKWIMYVKLKESNI